MVLIIIKTLLIEIILIKLIEAMKLKLSKEKPLSIINSLNVKVKWREIFILSIIRFP